MWTRFHIKCINCDKVTNLRIQIPEREELPVKYNCLGCNSEIKALITVNFEKASWDFKVERGELVVGEFMSGDYFYEFSDTLPTKAPSDQPHDTILATLRMPTKELMSLKDTKDQRKMFSEEDWQDLIDLTHAFSRSDKNVIERLSKKMLSGIYPESFFKFKNDLDYQRAYFSALNFMIYPWIDFDNHSEFIDWLNNNIFSKSNKSNAEIINFVQNIVSDDLIQNLKEEIAELIIRFIEIKDLLFFAYNENLTTDSYVSIEGFVKIKNFFTDCFEFIGRNSHLIFRLQNFQERGALDAVPAGVPRNVSSASDFAGLDNGRKIEILKLSSDIIPQKIYTKSFDNKIRNGINHYKAKLDFKSQVIKYYPITSRPDEEYQLKYIDFLNLTLDIFNSTLKIAQLIKFVTIYKVFLNLKTNCSR